MLATVDGKARFAWWQDWRGECVAIVGSGPSAKGANPELLRNRVHVIAINESWRLVPWADVLYGCDAAWWRVRAGVPEFSGLKVRGRPLKPEPQHTIDENVCKGYGGRWGLVGVDAVSDELLTGSGTVGGGGNSGFQAINLAMQFGATGIALVGFDFRGDHWHGRHPQPLRNPDESSFPRWRKALDGCSAKLKRLGVDVVNCSPVSTLQSFPIMSVDLALRRWSL